jgi:hypothetical protein
MATVIAAQYSLNFLESYWEKRPYEVIKANYPMEQPQ